MKVTIEINCDNDAFSGAPAWCVGTILRDYGWKLVNGEPNDIPADTPLHDTNGNTVGHATLSES
jgi:hypothetical protein